MGERFGFYLFVKKIAEKGVFTIAGKNSIDSVMESNLHEVYMYADAQAAQEWLEELNEIRNEAKQRKKK